MGVVNVLVRVVAAQAGRNLIEIYDGATFSNAFTVLEDAEIDKTVEWACRTYAK